MPTAFDVGFELYTFMQRLEDFVPSEDVDMVDPDDDAAEQQEGKEDEEEEDVEGYWEVCECACM